MAAENANQAEPPLSRWQTPSTAASIHVEAMSGRYPAVSASSFGSRLSSHLYALHSQPAKGQRSGAAQHWIRVPAYGHASAPASHCYRPLPYTEFRSNPAHCRASSSHRRGYQARSEEAREPTMSLSPNGYGNIYIYILIQTSHAITWNKPSVHTAIAVIMLFKELRTSGGETLPSMKTLTVDGTHI